MDLTSNLLGFRAGKSVIQGHRQPNAPVSLTQGCVWHPDHLLQTEGLKDVLEEGSSEKNKIYKQGCKTVPRKFNFTQNKLSKRRKTKYKQIIMFT